MFLLLLLIVAQDPTCYFVLCNVAMWPNLLCVLWTYSKLHWWLKWIIIIMINNCYFEVHYSFETLLLRFNSFNSKYRGSREPISFMFGSCTCVFTGVTQCLFVSQLLNNKKNCQNPVFGGTRLPFVVFIAMCGLPMSLNLVASGHSAPTRNPVGLHSYCLPC